jgi:hypothetical protein
MKAKAKLSRGCPLAGHARHEKLIKTTRHKLLQAKESLSDALSDTQKVVFATSTTHPRQKR